MHVLVLALVLTLLSPAAAFADDAAPGATVLQLDGSLGWTEGSQAVGITMGASARVRWHVLAAGGGLQAVAVFGTVASAFAHAGLSVPVGPLRFDALGELGLNAYDGVGRSYLGDNPGASAVLPYAGGRAAVLVQLTRRPDGIRVWTGLTGHYAADLRTIHRTYAYSTTGFGGGDRTVATDMVDIGHSRLAVLATLGLDFEI